MKLSTLTRIAFPVLLVGSTGCFATRGDVRILQGDLANIRSESQRSAQQQAQVLSETVRVLQAVSDSLSRISVRQTAFEGDTRGSLRRVNEQLVQVQELLGQSASIIRSLRADIETSGRMNPAAVIPEGGAAGGGGVGSPPLANPVSDTGVIAPNPALPGPSQLYQDGTDHMRRGSYASARIAFNDLLLNYPSSDLSPEAQYWIAEAYAAEKNLVAAGTAFGAVVSKYPDSPRAPDAMFKRALMLLEQGDNANARTLLEQLVQNYPSSNAADLAKERLASVP